jgi:hypothetical protein
MVNRQACSWNHFLKRKMCICPVWMSITTSQLSIKIPYLWLLLMLEENVFPPTWTSILKVQLKSGLLHTAYHEPQWYIPFFPHSDSTATLTWRAPMSFCHGQTSAIYTDAYTPRTEMSQPSLPSKKCLTQSLTYSKYSLKLCSPKLKSY